MNFLSKTQFVGRGSTFCETILYSRQKNRHDFKYATPARPEKETTDFSLRAACKQISMFKLIMVIIYKI